MTLKIIYIHGFNSGGKSDKIDLLKMRFGEVIAPTLPYSPKAAIRLLETEIARISDDDTLVLVGTSLGGYYAQYLGRKHGIKTVLINPAIIPVATLFEHIGKTLTNHVTGEEHLYTKEEWKELFKLSLVDGRLFTRTVPTLVFLDAGDELLDSAATANYYSSVAKVKVFEGGNHRFAHMADILEDIAALEHLIYL